MLSCTQAIPRATVAITNLTGSSGGSGSIIESSVLESLILTNSHVCEILKRGGLVHTVHGEYFADSFRQSKIHDLCLVKVLGDLGVKTAIASSAPDPFDSATVSGHPMLLPTIITEGHFSFNAISRVVTGIKECTDQDRQDPYKAFICAILGGLPEVKAYESTIVSPTIQPGSSGSAVYNSKGEIAAVIFAGSGTISYGVAVPWRYVSYFINVESKELTEHVPNTAASIFDTASSRSYKSKVDAACMYVTDVKTKGYCDSLQRDLDQMVNYMSESR